jgi:drug/metabolite transporter (DMT)-like permease
MWQRAGRVQQRCRRGHRGGVSQRRHGIWSLWRLLVVQKVRGEHSRAAQAQILPAIGLLIGVQSLCLYSAVARLPVALALLAFNTYPLWTALWACTGVPQAARALRW